jgi:hypothetical protein
MTTVTQFKKPGERDANNSNPVSKNLVDGNEILPKKNIKIFYINRERNGVGFSTTVI